MVINYGSKIWLEVFVRLVLTKYDHSSQLSNKKKIHQNNILLSVFNAKIVMN